MGKLRRSNPIENSKQPHRLFYPGLWLVLLIFFVLSAAYSVIVPITQGEDELAHYRYIKFIAQTGRLPVNYQEREQAWYRADWPPLYHLLVGLAVNPLDTTRPHLKDVGESPRRRLVGEIFYPRLIIYTEDASWPWQDGILAWHIGRFISILFSGIALIFTYFTALEMCDSSLFSKAQTPEAKTLPPCRSPQLFATATTALLAFTPRFLFTSAMLGDDSLFILISAIFIWLLLRTLRGNDRWWLYAILGLLLGLSLATKYSTALLPLVLIPVVWWQAKQTHQGWLRSSGRLALAWIFTLIGTSWWFGWLAYYFNTIKEDGPILGVLGAVLATGPDVSMRRVFALLGGEQFTGPIRPGAVGEGTVAGWFTYLFQTFWGVPVLEHDPLFPWVYLLVLLLCLLAVIGLWWYWKIANSQRRVDVGVLLLIVIVLVPFPLLRFFLTYNILETGQGRHLLYPAAQSTPILLMLGWFTFVQLTINKEQLTITNEQTPHPTPHIPHLTSRISHLTFHAPRSTYYVLLVAPAFLLVWSLFQLYYMSKTYPDPLPVQTTTFNRNAIPQPLKHNFTDDIQFLGYDFQPDADQATINLTLFWKALDQVDENYRLQIQLVDPSGQPHLTWLSHPLNGLYPTRAWDKGDVIRDTLSLPLAGLPPDDYLLELDLLPEAENTPLTAEPFWIIQVPLAQTYPIPNAKTFNSRLEYHLWRDAQPLRYRQTVGLSWANTNSNSGIERPAWFLIGPDNIPRPPVATGDATAVFMVGGDWPSGDYRLGLAGGEATLTPVLTVTNEARLFDPSALPGPRTPIEANFANKVKLLGYTLHNNRVEPGGGINLDLVWQSLAPVLPDTVTFAVLLDAGRQPYGSVDRYPNGFYSPMLWVEGEVVPDSFTLPVQPDAPPGVYRVHLGQYRLLDNIAQSLRLYHQGEPTDDTAVVIGPIKVGGPPPGLTINNPTPQITLNQPLGDEITLLGYDLNINPEPETLNSELKTLNLKLYWQANSNIDTDYTTFLHLRDAADKTIIQKDSPPAGGLYPSSLWDAGEIIADDIILPLGDTQAGQYTPVVGLYNFNTGDRLPTPGNPANEIRLKHLTITHE